MSYKTDARFIIYVLHVIAGMKLYFFSSPHLGFTGNVTYRPDCRLMFQFTSLLIAISCQIANQLSPDDAQKLASSLLLSPNAQQMTNVFISYRIFTAEAHVTLDY